MADLLIVGGGPAGLATDIEARLVGLEATVIDRRRPPIDVACGEGLMPGFLLTAERRPALRRLVIRVLAGSPRPFSSPRQHGWPRRSRVRSGPL